MATVNETLQSRAIAHAVLIQRYGTGVADKIVRLLNSADQEIIERIAARLALIEERGFDTGPATSARLNAMLEEIQALNSAIYASLATALTDELIDFSAAEADYQRKALVASIGADLSTTLPAPERLRAIVTESPMEGRLLASWADGMRLDLNYAWGTTDLTQIVTQYGTQGDIFSGIAGYQNAVSKGLLASTLKGVRAALQANTAITHDIATDFDMEAIYDANATAEEWSSMFRIMLCSYTRFAKLQAAEQNGFVPASQTNTGFAEYQGFTLLKTNTLTADEIITARLGAIGYGEGTAQQAFEVERKANGGNGGGADILHSRFSRVIAPQGLDYKGAIPTTSAQVKAVLEAAASWDKVAPDAQFGFRFINFNVA